METNENNMQENVVENTAPMGEQIPTEEPKKKNNKGLLIGIVVVVVIALIGLGVYFATKKSPLTMVDEGFEKTMASVRPGMGEYLGSKELMEFMEAGVYEQTLKVSLDQITSADEYTDFSMFSGIEFGTDAAVDRANKKMDTNLYVSYGGAKLVDANIYANNSNISIAEPQYFEGFLSADTSNFGADFNQSALSSLLQMQLTGTESFIVFPDEEEETTEEASTESSDIISSLQQNIAKFDQELLVEKTKNKKEFEVGGVVESCEEYTMKLPKELLDEALNSYVNYFNSMPMSQQEVMSTFMDEIEKMEFTDVMAYLYLDKQGRLINMSFDADYVLPDNEPLSATFSLTAQGKEYLWDDFDCNISYVFSGELGTLDLGWKKTSTVEGSAITSNHEITLSDADITMVMNASILFNPESGDIAITGTAAPDDAELGNIGFELKGKFTEVNKGTGFTLDITDMILTTDGDQNSVSFSGSYRLAPLAREIKAPEGTERNILTMSEEELSGFALEVLMNFEQTPIGQLMGGLY